MLRAVVLLLAGASACPVSDDLMKVLSSSGVIENRIRFTSGLCIDDSDNSQELIQAVARLMSESSSLRVMIEGHVATTTPADMAQDRGFHATSDHLPCFLFRIAWSPSRPLLRR